MKFLFWQFRSLFYYKYIDGGGGKIIFRNTSAKVIIKKGKNSIFNLCGNLTIVPFLNDCSPVVIEIADGAIFEIKGDFILGEGVKISISKNASLTIGGKLHESGSGITGRSYVMVNKKIVIGTDFLCAWDVYITDSDWHTIDNKPHQRDVIIGDHVWIANNNNILKGTILENNCIIASCSKISNLKFGPNVIVAGMPGKVIKENITWSRDI